MDRNLSAPFAFQEDKKTGNNMLPVFVVIVYCLQFDTETDNRQNQTMDNF